MRLSARKRVLRIYGKGQRVREVPIHPELRKVLMGWLDERPDWPAAKTGPALFLNKRGQRLSVRGAHDVITGIAARGGLDDRITAHVLSTHSRPRSCAGGTDLVIAAELLGHARLETTRASLRVLGASWPKPLMGVQHHEGRRRPLDCRNPVPLEHLNE